MTCTFVRYPMEVHVTHSVIASQEKFPIFSHDRGGHGDFTEASGSPCVSVHSAENPSQPGKDFRLHKLHKMKPQMNTDRCFHLCSSVFICGFIHSGVSP